MQEIEILKNIGLTEYESQVVLILLSRGSLKAGEIAKKCSVPKNKIYESLEMLSKKGIVQVIPSTPKRYFIRGIDTLKNLIKEKEDKIRELKENFSALEKIKNKPLGIIKESIGIIYGHEGFLLKLKEALSRVSKENLVIMRKVRTDPTILRLTSEAIKRGAKVKMITALENKSKTKEWVKLGAKIKYIKEISEMTFSIFDDKICRLNLNITDNLTDPTLWVENKPFIHLLRDKFKAMWRTAKK